MKELPFDVGAALLELYKQGELEKLLEEDEINAKSKLWAAAGSAVGESVLEAWE